MSTDSLAIVSKATGTESLTKLVSQYGIGPAHFASTFHGFYERHLLFDFDNDIDPPTTNAREHYEAFARSVRDILSQRWVLTNKTYQPIPSAFITCRWNSALNARWPTM